MGADRRSLPEIVAHDGRRLAELGLDAAAIGARLEELTRTAVAAMGTPIALNNATLCSFEGMGWLVCPFGHAGLHAKSVMTLTSVATGKSVRWSALSAHLIREHGFFGGLGSPFRLEPDELAIALKDLQL